MNELLIYSSISLLCMVLFYFWYRRQGQTAERKWLLQKISKKSDQQQAYVEALSQLEKPTSNINITVLVGLLIIPATFIIDYIWFNDTPLEQQVSLTQQQSTNSEAPDLESAIKQLQQKLADNPDDVEGQILYGRSMMSLQNYEYAVEAYKKANQLDPNNAYILTELAEATAFKNNTGSFLGEPEQYLSQAIEIDPYQQKAMWLQGIVFYEKLEYSEAEAIWTDLIARVQSPNIKSTVLSQINQAREAQNKPTINVDSSISSTDAYFVVVNASEAVKTMTLNPTARLFIYAKQVNGPPMPIAATPLSQPFNWPMSVRLSDANSLNSGRKLSDFEQVEFSAKLSLSGSATPDIDDINSETKIANKNNPNVQLTITK